MILAHRYSSYYRSISDNIVSNFCMYNSPNDISRSDPRCEAPQIVKEEFDKLGFSIKDAACFGWVFNARNEIVLPAARIVFLDSMTSGEKVSPTIRYWCRDGWFTAKEVVEHLRSIKALED